MNPLEEKLLSIYKFQENDLVTILSYFKERKFPKKTFLLQEGEVSDRIYFLQSGLIREFSLNHNCQEFEDLTTGIAHEGKFVYSVDSYVNNLPSHFFIQALENTHTYYIERSSIEYLTESVHGASMMVSKIYENYLVDYEKRMQMLRLPNAMAAYEQFLKTYPDLSNRIPDKYIASYLNIHPKSLSTLRNYKRKL